MKIGLQIPHFRPSTREDMRTWLRGTLKIVDQGGFDNLWVMDHFFQLRGWLGEPETEKLERYTIQCILPASQKRSGLAYWWVGFSTGIQL